MNFAVDKPNFPLYDLTYEKLPELDAPLVAGCTGTYIALNKIEAGR